jgi:hypothetical protein
MTVSSFCRDTAYPVFVFRSFLQRHKTNAGIVPHIKPEPIPSTFFSIHYSLKQSIVRRYTFSGTDSVIT